MNRAREEELQRITAQYVAAVQAGRNPQLSDYLLRYPQYAHEITDFVAYYHTFEEDILLEIEEATNLPPVFRIAIKSTLARIEQEPRKIKQSRKKELGEYQRRIAEERVDYQMSGPPPQAEEN